MKKYSGAALFLLCLQFLQSLTFGFVLGQGAGDSLANYSPKWSWDWLASHGGPGDEALSFLSLNNQDQCLAVGSFSGTLKRPRGMLNSDGDSSDFFVTRLDTSGRWQWLERGGAAGEDEGYAVVGDSNSGILVAGSVTSFAGERGLKTGFVTRYHANGELDWLWQLETDTVMSEARVEHIAVRGNGELFFVATFSGSIHFNGLTIKSRAGKMD